MARNAIPRKGRENVTLEILNTAHSERSNSSILVERRMHQRYATSLEATVLSGSGTSAVATVVDLSLGGLRLQLDHRAFAALLPDESRSAAHNPVDLQVSFNLPGDPLRLPSIRATCKTVQTLHEEDGVFKVGIMFKTILDGRAALGHYLKYLRAIRY